MQHFHISLFDPQHDTDAWDAFLQRCPAATLMHTQRFLSYHGDRFEDRSLIVSNAKKQWLGVLPAATDPGLPTRVTSHPGLSYGGILHAGDLHGENMVQAFKDISQYYRSLGFETCRYKAVPYFYHTYPCQDDLYALFRLNANRYRCDLASIIDIENRPKLSSKRRWELQQALKQGVEVKEDNQAAPALWAVLEDNLSRKHGAKPVHSLQDILILKSKFPDEIRFVTASINEYIIAGFVLFITPTTIHLQYSASSAEGYERFALHPVVEYCVELARQLGKRYFDFGISNEQDGRYLNEGLHAFKGKFGSGGTIHEFFDLDLTQDFA